MDLMSEPGTVSAMVDTPSVVQTGTGIALHDLTKVFSVKRKDVTGSGKAIAHPDPRPAILQFARECRAAGARLVLMPIPDKAMLQPAQLTRRMKFDAPIAPFRLAMPGVLH